MTKVPLDTTLYAIGFALAGLKLLVSGNTILGLEMSKFSAGDFGTMMVALGSIHVARRHSDRMNNKEEK